MAEVDWATLALAAIGEPDGTISMLKVGVDRIGGHQFPMQLVIQFVARITFEDSELGQPHIIVIRVEHAGDGEQLARVEGPAIPVRPPTMLPETYDLPTGLSIIMPLALEFRRAGRYYVRLSIDGDEMKEIPLTVTVDVPQF